MAQRRNSRWHLHIGWRGPSLNGISTKADPPVEWSGTKNVKWKSAVPGSGFSTPIVWEQKVFLLAAMPQGEPASTNTAPQQAHKFHVLCLGRATGKTLWSREEAPHEGLHSGNLRLVHRNPRTRPLKGRLREPNSRRR